MNLYRAIVKSDGRLPENLQPKDVTERALADSCIDCRRALSLFCVIMGRFGGNLALTLGTFGESTSRADRTAFPRLLYSLRLPRCV